MHSLNCQSVVNILLQALFKGCHHAEILFGRDKLDTIHVKRLNQPMVVIPFFKYYDCYPLQRPVVAVDPGGSKISGVVPDTEFSLLAALLPVILFPVGNLAILAAVVDTSTTGADRKGLLSLGC